MSVRINKSTKRLTGTFRDVTESRKIQNELKVGESRLRRAEITSKSGNWELHLRTGKIIGSEGAMMLYGVKTSPMDLSIIQKMPLPEYRPMMDKALEDLIRHGKPYDIEFRIKKADTGEVLDIRSIADYVEFYIEDTGIGIAAAELPRIFERFYHVDRTESRNYGGTGLGLPISKGFTELLGGKIWVKSEVNSGSAFYFTIPCTHLHHEIQEVTAPVKSGETRTAGVKSILVAEDEESNFALIATFLRNSDYRIIRARNGQDAVDLFKKNSGVHLILMDIKMPLMDGYEAATEILKIKPNVPIIAQSAYAHQSDRALAIEIGFVDYLAKPFTREQLIGAVEKFIR